MVCFLCHHLLGSGVEKKTPQCTSTFAIIHCFGFHKSRTRRATGQQEELEELEELEKLEKLEEEVKRCKALCTCTCTGTNTTIVPRPERKGPLLSTAPGCTLLRRALRKLKSAICNLIKGRHCTLCPILFVLSLSLSLSLALGHPLATQLIFPQTTQGRLLR
ncbi:hypothetical protein M5D96_009035 [Drosophila gunungcola]|uniref:Uncharacterized protein n=1 Tax=Drosophila gunungcola TaxID=103775 RepID=A0A9P9YK36_9MUSC|nr:hypothetical protein M5D96_009035 [Drosophila gunungcola]